MKRTRSLGLGASELIYVIRKLSRTYRIWVSYMGRVAKASKKASGGTKEKATYSSGGCNRGVATARVYSEVFSFALEGARPLTCSKVRESLEYIVHSNTEPHEVRC